MQILDIHQHSAYWYSRIIRIYVSYVSQGEIYEQYAFETHDRNSQLLNTCISILNKYTYNLILPLALALKNVTSRTLPVYPPKAYSKLGGFLLNRLPPYVCQELQNVSADMRATAKIILWSDWQQ